MDDSKLLNINGGVYAFTNENLSDYLKNFKLFDKDILTVTGSGDQAFNIALQNPKSITCFDINPLAHYWMEFKKAGILTMGYEKFLDVFVNKLDYNLKNTKRAIDKGVYKSTIRDALGNDTREFWDSIEPKISTDFFNPYPTFGKTEIDTNKILSFITSTNSYLKNHDNYNKLKSMLPNLGIEHVNSCISKLPDTKYDAIFNSNISNHYKYQIGYKELLENKLCKQINPGGFAQVYILDFSHCFKRFSKRTHENLKLLEGFKVKLRNVKSIDTEFSLYGAEELPYLSIHKTQEIENEFNAPYLPS